MNRLTSAVLLILLAVSLQITAQEKYPIDYFDSPVDFPILLSGTFGELRTGHLHSGIDIRTQGAEGKSLKAVADGYVSRIVVSPVGFGKAIYIDHPNGYTSVYAHCQSFYPAVDTYVKEEQYLEESFTIDLLPEPGQFQVTKGQVIAKSGNSGSSGGPHLHFEIRNTETEKPINPLHFGFTVKDFTRPQIRRLRVYPYGAASLVDGKTKPKEFELAGWGPNYRMKSGDTINLSGDIYFGIEAVDQHNDSKYNNGFYSLQLLIDSVLVYSHVMNEFSFDETRYMQSLIDYPYFVRNKHKIQQTRILPNNPLSIYEKVKNKGVFNFNHSKLYRIQFVVGDFHGNESILTFHVKGDPFKGEIKPPDQSDYLMYWGESNQFEQDGLLLEIPEKALYDTIHFQFKTSPPIKKGYSPLYHLHNKYTPLHKFCDLYIKPEKFRPELKEKLLIVRVDPADNSLTAIGGSWDDDYITAKIRDFGNYTVVADTLKPTITPVNIQNGKNISAQSNIRITIKDDLAGIESYRATMNGNWILMEWDPKNNLLEYKIDEHTKKGKNQFRLSVKDTRGNERVYETSLTR
ncbi:MAG: M23 family metallopeptidase [Bacteroidales bacterium]|nr:M23 family metallopeptidase [Bacteroidales bacterium]